MGDNGGDGINLGAFSTIVNCLSRNNDDRGISAGDSVVARCAVAFNDGDGIGNNGGVTSQCYAKGHTAINAGNGLAHANSAFSTVPADDAIVAVTEADNHKD